MVLGEPPSLVLLVAGIAVAVADCVGIIMVPVGGIVVVGTPVVAVPVVAVIVPVGVVAVWPVGGNMAVPVPIGMVVFVPVFVAVSFGTVDVMLGVPVVPVCEPVFAAFMSRPAFGASSLVHAPSRKALPTTSRAKSEEEGPRVKRLFFTKSELVEAF
jgi:hypothetical protein